MFNVHNAGAQPFTCSTIRTRDGFLLTEVFKFALENLKTNALFRDKLKGVNIGGVVLDSCGSSVRAATLLSNFYGNRLILRDNTNTAIDPKTVPMYIGGSSSTQVDRMSNVLNTLAVPLISYSATATVLENTYYPYFLRTIPNDRKHAKAIVSFLKRYGQKNIQVLYSDNTYGRGGVSDLILAARMEGICIAAQQRVSSNTSVDIEAANNVAASLLKRPNATVVVMFMHMEYTNAVLQAVGRNPMILGKYLFVGTSAWGSVGTVVANVQDQVYANSVTFAEQTADVLNFEREYLSRPQMNPNHYTVNPWFSEYYQDLFQCSLSDGSQHYPRKCASSTLPLTASQSYRQDMRTLHVLNAVYSIALGLHDALVSTCGANYNGVCQNFTLTAERRKLILSKIKSVSFIDETGKTFQFQGKPHCSLPTCVYCWSTLSVSTQARAATKATIFSQ